jgi:EpsI family protein
MRTVRCSIPIYAIVTLALLAGVGVHRVTTRTFSDATAYHVKVKEAVDAIPFRVGDWVGEDVPIPTAATALLKPNALLARTYRRSDDGRAVSLAVVQCEDTRDMAGHYPPICFRAHGWSPLGSERIRNLNVEGLTLPVTLYLFERASAFETTQRSVYNLLVLPGIGGVDDMPDVRKAAANPLARQRGAAQIQIVLSSEMPQADQREAVREFLTTLAPAIKAVIQFEPQTGR